MLVRKPGVERDISPARLQEYKEKGFIPAAETKEADKKQTDKKAGKGR